MLGEMGREYVAAIGRYAAANQVPLLRFEKNACKEDVARPFLEAAEREGRFGVVLVGKAQEKAYAWRGAVMAAQTRIRTSSSGASRCSSTTTTSTSGTPSGGPAFVKTDAYAPFPVWVYLNGHEWAKRQAPQQGLDASGALDNGFRACDDAAGAGGDLRRRSVAQRRARRSSTAGCASCPRR